MSKLLLAAISTLIGIAAVEAVVRRLPDSQRLLMTPSSIPGAAYQIEPNSVVKTPSGDIHIDSWGFRYPEFPREKPAGELRVFAIGDSVVFGQGVAQGDFSAVLERDLGEKLPAGVSRLRVVNTGVPGYNDCQELALLNGLVESFSPDLILVGYVMNDPEGAHVPFGMDVEHGTMPPWWRAYHWVKGRFATLKYAAEKLAPLVARLRGRSSFAPPVDPNDEVRYVSVLHDPKGAYWPACASCIAKLGDYRKAKGVPVLFVIFPLFNHLDSKDLVDAGVRVGKAARAAGLATLDLYPDFKNLSRDELDRYRGDGMHPSEAGHRFVAGVVEAYLKRHPELLRTRR
jgi:lysophospholipase L1-like esterase